MSKYIINNCPAIYINQNNEYDCDKAEYFCKDCTDCVMKQIVDECYTQEKLVDETKETEPDFQYYYGRYIFAREILQLLNIQEVE